MKTSVKALDRTLLWPKALKSALNRNERSNQCLLGIHHHAFTARFSLHSTHKKSQGKHKRKESQSKPKYKQSQSKPKYEESQSEPKYEESQNKPKHKVSKQTQAQGEAYEGGL